MEVRFHGDSASFDVADLARMMQAVVRPHPATVVHLIFIRKNTGGILLKNIGGISILNSPFSYVSAIMDSVNVFLLRLSL